MTTQIEKLARLQTAQAIVVFCACPTEQLAQDLAAALVEQNFAACVNILPGVRSVYRWRDAIEQETESLMLIKTTAARYSAVESYLQMNHPYELPEVIGVTIEHGLSEYLKWIGSETR